MQRLESACCSLQKMVLLLMAIITWNAEETSLCNKEFILWKKSLLFNNTGLVATQQILLPVISMKMSLIISEMENWSPNFGDLNLLDYVIWDIKKKILYKNLKRYADIEGLSAAMSYASDRLTKRSSINSIHQWRMYLEKVVEEGNGYIVHLIWQHWFVILRILL